MPLYLLDKEDDFEEILLEQRLNILVFTVCWSLGSKMVHPTIFDLSNNPNLSQVHFYRVELDESNPNLSQRWNIMKIPTVRWYFHGNQLDELIGIDLEQLIEITSRLAHIYQSQTVI